MIEDCDAAHLREYRYPLHPQPFSGQRPTSVPQAEARFQSSLVPQCRLSYLLQRGAIREAPTRNRGSLPCIRDARRFYYYTGHPNLGKADRDTIAATGTADLAWTNSQILSGEALDCRSEEGKACK